MTIRYALNLEDYYDFNLYHLKNSSTSKRTFNITRFAVPVMYMIMPFTLFKNSQMPTYMWLAIFAVVSILWVLYYPKRYESLIRKRLKKMINNPQNAHFTSENKLVLNDKHFTVVNEKSETIVELDELVKVVDMPNHFYLYVGDLSAYIIPKRAFETNEDSLNFYKAVQNK